jgi:hypothetical protein
MIRYWLQNEETKNSITGEKSAKLSGPYIACLLGINGVIGERPPSTDEDVQAYVMKMHGVKAAKIERD